MYKCLDINYFMKYYFYVRENLVIQRVNLFLVILMIFAILLLSTGGILKNEETKEGMDFITSFIYLNNSYVRV